MNLAIFISIVAALAVPFLLFFFVRYKQRQTKNFQRGLSMVPLKIHLPPISEDVEAKARDERDVVEENISKATVLYNLLVSTAEKQGFKTNYYGQPHFSFEIIAEKGFVCLYAVAPKSLAPILRQSIVSTYKGAKLEEVEEYDLFREDSKTENLLGGELALKKDFAYPISTYLESRQDIMKVLLGALSELDNQDSAGIQIMLRPTRDTWTKEAQEVAKKLAKQEKDGNFFKELLWGFVREPKKEDKERPVELSSLDKSLIEAIEKKVTQPGFEVLIRILVAARTAPASRDIYRNILAGFALLDAPKSNGFKGSETKNMDKFLEAFSLRLFPQGSNKNILNTNELATIFHLPNQANIPTSQLERQTSKQVDGPRNFLKEGLLLGHNLFRNQSRPVVLGDEDRMRHMYVLGQTGTGKSVFLENLALQDIKAGKGFALVDPHGETAEKVLRQIPQKHLDKVIYFDPGNMDYPMGLNIFEHRNPDQQDFLIQEAIAMLYKLYDPNQQGIMGPRYEYMFRNAAKLIMADPQGGTFIDIPKLFNDRRLVNQKLQHVSDQPLIDFWRKEIVDSARSNEFGDIKSWFVSKFSAFLSNNMMRNIIGQNRSSFDLRQVMDEGKIMIINLSHGRVGELNMKLLGMLFVAKFQMAAMSRADVPENQRSDFTLYIDEFQNFTTESFANILSSARKYRLALVVANQHTGQLTEEVRDAVYGNVGTAVAFRINAQDAEHMVKQFYSPSFEIDDLTRLSTGQAVVRTLVKGAPTMPFNINTLPPNQVVDSPIEETGRQQARQHGRPRQEVEKEIFDRLNVKAEDLPPIPPIAPMPSMPPPPDLSLPKPDQRFAADWLKHRQTLKERLAAQEKHLSEELSRQKQLKAKLAEKQAELKSLESKRSESKDSDSQK